MEETTIEKASDGRMSGALGDAIIALHKQGAVLEERLLTLLDRLHPFRRNIVEKLGPPPEMQAATTAPPQSLVVEELHQIVAQLQRVEKAVTQALGELDI